MAMQGGVAAIDEALRQGFMQGIGKTIFNQLRATLPMRRIGHPVATIGDIGPGADMGDALHELLDVPIDAIQSRQLSFDPIGWQSARQVLANGEIAIKLPQQAHMRIGHQLAEIRYLADIPEQSDAFASLRQMGDLGITGQVQ